MALPQAQSIDKQFNPEEYPNDFHICSNRNGKVIYGSIIHNQPFYIIGENGKETEIGRYEVCTKCRNILHLKFNPNFPDKYKHNIHMLFKENPTATFFYKDEVLNGYLNKDLTPKPNEDYEAFKSRFISDLKRLGYAYTRKQ